MTDPALSVVVVACDMARELPRTIRTLSPAMQREISAEDYEIVVVDNGSTPPVRAECAPAHGARIRFVRMDRSSQSPVAAVNVGLRAARGELVGALIDGARMASPGLLAGALRGHRLHRRPVIAALSFHLGSAMQMESVRHGYGREAEDLLLASTNWEEDGYQLFSISVFAGSSAGGYFSPMAESNALFLPRALWAELGGYDERFAQPGGGLVNLDTYRRACSLPGSQLVVLLGEGTFHQFHGGVATNALVSPWEVFHEEYVRLRGEPYSVPRVDPVFVGRIRTPTLPALALSAAGDRAGVGVSHRIDLDALTRRRSHERELERQRYPAVVST